VWKQAPLKFAVVVLLGVLTGVSGLEADQPFNPRVQRISVDDGLAQAAVHAILEDASGFVWFATRDGLSRYDGHEFVNYRTYHEDPHSLSNSSVWALVEDENHILWIGTSGGLNRYDPRTEEFTSYRLNASEAATPADRVFALCLAGEHDILAGSHSGLQRFDRNRLEFVPPADDPVVAAVGKRHVLSILVDSKGETWVGTTSGLVHVSSDDRQPRVFQKVANDPRSLSNDRVSALFEDSNGQIWVGTWGGLDRFEPETHSFSRVMDPTESRPSVPHPERVQGIAEDNEGRIWTASGSVRVFKPDGDLLGELQHDYWMQNSLSWNVARAVTVGRAGYIWIGTDGYGLNLVDPFAPAISHLAFRPARKDSLAADYVQSVFAEHDDRVWIGTAKGLDLYLKNENRTIHFRHDPDDPRSLNDDSVTRVIKDREDRVWIATRDGVARWDGRGKFRQYLKSSDSRPALVVLDMVEGPAPNTLWLAATQSVVLFDTKSGQTELLEAYLAEGMVLPAVLRPTSLLCDRTTLWIGTAFGLLRVNTESGELNRFVHDPNDSSSIGGSFVKGLTLDSTKTLWVATWGGGLSKFNSSEGSFTRFGEQDGLPSAVVYGVLEAVDGGFWMSTNAGLARLDPDDNSFYTLSASDGLQGSEYNTGAFCASENGTLYFGGLRGLDFFHPSAVRPNPHPPTTRITNMKQGENRVSIQPQLVARRSGEAFDPIELPWSREDFSFEFVGIGYTAPTEYSHTYKLEPIDEEWTEPGPRRFARYTRLPPGRFIFRVRAQNNDGVWDEKEEALAFVILTPWWMTLWFRGSMILLIVGVGIVAFKRRTLRLRQLNDELEARVTERTAELKTALEEIEAFSYSVSHDLRAPLRAIAGFSHILVEDHHEDLNLEARDYLERIESAASRMGVLIDGLLSLSRVQRRPLERREVDMSELVKSVLDDLVDTGSGQKPEISVEENLVVFADPTLLRILLENLFSNAIKFSLRCDDPKIEVGRHAFPEDEKAFFVRDNGVGFNMAYSRHLFGVFNRLHSDPEYPGTGIGLATVHRIVKRHQGKIWAEGKPGEGATFFFTLGAVAPAEASGE
jgi:ligand-binding sensor domain-containing protein/signal transduction histidine kinase